LRTYASAVYNVANAEVKAVIAIKAHFDGKYLVPDEPLNVPKDQPLRVQIDVAQPAENEIGNSSISELLKGLAKAAEECPLDSALPADGAAQHDSYLYGSPKR
jgi:hypothetical protein